jgi:hypothetical protein
MTPEGKVKKAVKYLLDTIPLVYYEYDVPVGYGRPRLDFTGCSAGRFFAVETKAPGEWLTPRQRVTALHIHEAGGRVFIISGELGLAALERWLTPEVRSC